MKDILATPLGELISSIGNGVADAQAALDEASLAKTLEIYNNADDQTLELLRQIGYQPSFYAIPETEVEANVSLSLSANTTTDTSVNKNGLASRDAVQRTRVYATPNNASNANKYAMQANASATLKFKIVPVPPSIGVSALRVAPDLTDRTIAEIETLLRDFNLNYEINNDSGSGKIISQVPDPGTILKEGDIIEINL